MGETTKTLTREKIQLFDYKKNHYYQSNKDIAESLGMTQEALFLASLGRPVPADVYDAIMEWIEQ